MQLVRGSSVKLKRSHFFIGVFNKLLLSWKTDASDPVPDPEAAQRAGAARDTGK